MWVSTKRGILTQETVMRFLLAAVVLVGESSISLATQTDLAVSTFDSDAEGWLVKSLYWPYGNDPATAGPYTPVPVPSGGNPSGYISIVDPDALAGFWCAPGKFLGNKSAAYGGTLSFAAKDVGGEGANWDLMAVLVGTDATLYSDDFPVVGESWTACSIDLRAGANWHVNTTDGIAPTEGQFRGVLSNLKALYLPMDWTYPYDTSSLDSVKMTGESVTVVPIVPEPVTVLSVFIGLAGPGRHVRHRCRSTLNGRQPIGRAT
jgi:hypothetical protein